MEKVFLTYINTSECNSYSLTGTINNEFVDIDASKRFIHIPLHGDQHGFDNSIKLKVNCTEQNDSFRSIPFCMWALPVSNAIKHRYQIHLPDQLNFFVEESINWLGTQSSLNTQIKIKKPIGIEENPNLVVNQKHTLHRLKVAMKNFSYVPDSWIVCYKFHPSKLNGPYKSYGPQNNISIRIDKSLKFSPMHDISRFNYITIGNKTISMDKVLYVAKVKSIWDYMRDLKICERILSVHNQPEYNGPSADFLI